MISLLFSREDASLLLRNNTHTGTIRGLDFNVYQSNLLASAGSNSEVWIYRYNLGLVYLLTNWRLFLG